ncbi:MAG: LCP family protein, partial [Actinomycetota bacterium]
PYVNQRRELAGGGDDAGAQAIKLGIAQLLGVPIQYYVLVDMGGFIHVVDALGGIDLTTTRRVPAPGNPMEAKHLVPAWIEAGRQHFDGTLALSYARSRSADDDYRRMERQRCVLAGIASGATIRAIFTGLGDLVDAFGDSVRTDIPRDRLGDFVQIIERYTAAGGLNAVHTLILTPPVIQPSYWNLAHVRDLVKEVLAAPHPTNGTTTTVSATATPSTPGTTPGPTSGTTAGDTLGTECT